MNPTESQTGAAATASQGPEVSAEVLQTLAEIGEEVNSSLDLDEVLARTAALIKRHIDYEIFGVLMFESDGSYLKHRFSIGYAKELAESLNAVECAGCGVGRDANYRRLRGQAVTFVTEAGIGSDLQKDRCFACRCACAFDNFQLDIYRVGENVR